MSTYDKSYVKTHHVAGLILGLLGIAIALLLTVVAGVIAGALAAILGLVGLLLGLQARKAGKGWPAIIAGALAIILAVVMTVSSVGIYKLLHEKALENGNTPMIEKYCRNPYLGVVGIVIEAAKDGEQNIDQLTQEIDTLNKMETLSVTVP